jgi:hypothetical protein
METRQMAERVLVLQAEGLSLEDALRKVLEENKTTTRDTRYEWINNCDNIAALQEQAHKSHAKKSKMKEFNKPDKMAIYQAEIDACYARINVLRAKVSSDNPLQDLIKLGAKPSSVVQYWLKATEEKAEVKYAKLLKDKGWTKKQGKEACLKVSGELPEDFKTELAGIGESYLNNVIERLKAGDQRILALVRKWNLVS